jgi:hypothetical protein
MVDPDLSVETRSHALVLSSGLDARYMLASDGQMDDILRRAEINTRRELGSVEADIPSVRKYTADMPKYAWPQTNTTKGTSVLPRTCIVSLVLETPV